MEIVEHEKHVGSKRAFVRIIVEHLETPGQSFTIFGFVDTQMVFIQTLPTF